LSCHQQTAWQIFTHAQWKPFSYVNSEDYAIGERRKSRSGLLVRGVEKAIDRREKN